MSRTIKRANTTEVAQTLSTITLAAFAGIDDVMLTQFAHNDFNAPLHAVYYGKRRAPMTPDREHCLLTKAQAVMLMEYIGEHSIAQIIHLYVDTEYSPESPQTY